MKVAIIGSGGNLGTQLCRMFKRFSGWDPIPLRRGELDITKPEEVHRAFRTIRPHVIINTAAYNAVDRCEEDEAEFLSACRINGEAVGFLAAASLEVGGILVHYSSDYVFRGDRPEGYEEEDVPDPLNRYGISKLMGERTLLEYRETDLKWFLIRTSKLFGPRGESPRSKPSFFDTMLSLAQKKPSLNVVNGERSCFTYTPDLAAATRALLERGEPRRIYHVVNTGACTWYEAACVLFELTGLQVHVEPVPSERFPRPAKRPPSSVLLNTRLPALRPWQSALKEYLEARGIASATHPPSRTIPAK